MTEQELLADDHFLGACKQWERERRCPYKLVDWFLDRDLERLAEAARWAHNTRREGLNNYDPFSGYVLPFRCEYDGIGYHTFHWFSIASFERNNDFIPSDLRLDRSGGTMSFKTFPEAIAWLLVNFDHEAAFARTESA